MVKGSQIPKYIAASTPQGLRRLMFKTNMRLGYFIQYFDIQFVNGKWYAWFYIDIELELEKGI